MRYATVMAGGSGTRLWPMSRAGLPKQLIPFIRGRSLLEIAVDRLAGLVDATPPSSRAALLDSIMDYFDIPPTGTNEWRTPVPTSIALSARPNPFTAAMNIRYTIQDAGCTMEEVKLGIYDVSGRLVKSWDHASCIMDHESVVQWDGDDSAGRQLPSGVYFVRLQAADLARTVKTVLLR